MYKESQERVTAWYQDRFGWDVSDVPIIPVPREIVHPESPTYFVAAPGTYRDMDEEIETEMRVTGKVLVDPRIDALDLDLFRIIQEKESGRGSGVRTQDEKEFLRNHEGDRIYAYPLFEDRLLESDDYGEILTRGFIAHELFHILQFRRGFGRLDVISEGSALAAEQLYGEDNFGDRYRHIENVFAKSGKRLRKQRNKKYEKQMYLGKNLINVRLGIQDGLETERKIHKFSGIFKEYEALEVELWLSLLTGTVPPSRR